MTDIKEHWQLKCQTCGMAVYDDECACTKEDLRQEVAILREHIESLSKMLGGDE